MSSSVPLGSWSIPLEGDSEAELRRLGSRSPRLALLVEASSTRRDARQARARLLLLLLSLACPRRQGAPRRAWYVPGAVARMGPEALLRAWARTWGEAPCLRTLRRHLAALEDCLALVRQPGDRIASLRQPGRAPRYPDTLHVLDDEQDAGWWERVGSEVLRRHPEVRTSPEAWRSRLGSWRAQARSRQLELFEPARAPLAMPGHEPVPDAPEARRAAAHGVARALRQGPLELMEALRHAGVHMPARAQLDGLARPAGLARAAALFALALSRGDRVRDGWAWLRAALRRATPQEGRRALRRLGVDDHGGGAFLGAAGREPRPPLALEHSEGSRRGLPWGVRP